MKKILIANILCALALLWATENSYGKETEASIGDHFDGEILKYNFGFWIFHHVGEGVVFFRSLGNDQFEAVHEGRTVGVGSWATQHRRDFYHSTMTTTADGTRLIPLRFEEDVTIGLKMRKRITTYDYSHGKVVIETEKEGKVIGEEVPIPDGVRYDDPLTAFYNFRFGVYGGMAPGKEFVIPTAPRHGNPKDIRLSVASREEQLKALGAEDDKENKDFLVHILLDKELVGSLQGRVFAWFSKDRVPLGGVAKDVFFYGDINGRLTYRGFSSSPEKLNLPR